MNPVRALLFFFVARLYIANCKRVTLTIFVKYNVVPVNLPYGKKRESSFQLGLLSAFGTYDICQYKNEDMDAESSLIT